jgi:hypothetical protein
MFSLIISIISIALVVILAGASLYYGGDAFNKGGAKGEAAQFANEGQQIAAAVTMFKSDNGGTAPTAAETELVPSYLKSVPVGWSVEATGVSAAKTVTSSEVCILVGEQPGTDISDVNLTAVDDCSTSANEVTLTL